MATSVDGVDTTTEGVKALRDEVIKLRDASMRKWPDTIEETVILTHVIVVLAQYQDGDELRAVLRAASKQVDLEYQKRIDCERRLLDEAIALLRSRSHAGSDSMIQEFLEREQRGR